MSTATGRGLGLQLASHGRVGVVCLDRPPVNTLDGGLLDRIGEVFRSPGLHLPGTRAIALVSRGPHFSAGHDRREQHRLLDESYLQDAVSALALVSASPLPVVAGIHGAAAGTGFILACCADLLVCDAAAQLWLPEVELGIVGGAGHAARLVPMPLVRHLVLTGARMSGAQLVAHGGALPVPPGSTASQSAIALAATLADRPQAAIARARQVLAELERSPARIHRREMELAHGLVVSDATGTRTATRHLTSIHRTPET